MTISTKWIEGGSPRDLKKSLISEWWWGERTYLCVNIYSRWYSPLSVLLNSTPYVRETQLVFNISSAHYKARLLLRTSWDLCDAANVVWHLEHKSSCVTAVFLTSGSSFHSLWNPTNNSTNPRGRSVAMFVKYTYFSNSKKNLSVHSGNVMKKGDHEVLNDRANMNCVTSSSPTTGLRTIHLLRSILFRALPWHAIPAESSPLKTHFVYILILTFKSATSQVSRANTTPLSRRRSVSEHRSGNSHWISCGLSDFALTQFNLPVVISMMKHDFLK